MNNKPTDAQLNTLYTWLSWVILNAEARRAVKWIENNKTRQDTSREMSRLYDLKKNHSLTRETLFRGSFWQDYK